MPGVSRSTDLVQQIISLCSGGGSDVVGAAHLEEGHEGRVGCPTDATKCSNGANDMAGTRWGIGIGMTGIRIATC